MCPGFREGADCWRKGILASFGPGSLHWIVSMCFLLASSIPIQASAVIRVGYLGEAEGFVANEYWSAFGVAIAEANSSSPNISFSISRVWASPSNTSNCTEAAKDLVRDDIHAVVAAVNTACMALAIPVFGAASTPVLSAITSSHSLLSGVSGSDFLFSLSASDEVVGGAFAAVLENYRWSSMSFVSINSHNSSDIAQSISNASRSGGHPVQFGQQLTLSNASGEMRGALDQVVGIGTGVNLLDVSDTDTADEAFLAMVNRTPAVTGRGWLWLLNSQAAIALLRASAVEIRLTMQGTLAVVPPVSDRNSSLWMRYNNLLPSLPQFTSALATCQLIPDTFPIHVPFRAQIIDSVQLLQAVAMDSSSLLLNAIDSSVKSIIYSGLLAINSSAEAIMGISGSPFYFTATRYPANPRLDVVSFDSDRWVRIGSWSPEAGFLLVPGTVVGWPAFSSQPPSELAPGFRPRFKVGFLYIKVNGTAESRDNNLGREFLSAFNVSILHLSANSSASILFEPVPMGVNSDADCRQAAIDLASEVHVIIGGYRSSCTMEAAGALANETVPLAQIGYGATLERLSDTSAFPWFLRVVPPDTFQGQALADLVRYYGWSRVAILFTNNSAYAMGLRDSFLVASNGSLLNSTVVTVNVALPENLDASSVNATIDGALSMVFGNDTRVVLLLVYSSLAERIVLRGARPGASVPADGWIWVGTDSSTAFTPLEPQIRDAVAGTVGTRPKGGEGYVYLQLLSEWLQLNRTENHGVVFTASDSQTQPFVPNVFDAVQVVETALTDLLARKSISQLSSRDDVRRRLFYQLLSYNSSSNGFFGSIGSTIYFDSMRNGPAEYDIVNFQGGQWRKIGDWIDGRMSEGQAGKPLQLSLLTILPNGKVAPAFQSPPSFDVLYVALSEEFDPRLERELDLVRDIAQQYISNQETFSIRLRIQKYVPQGPVEVGCGSQLVDMVEGRGGFGYVAILGLLESNCAITASNAFRERGLNIPLISFGATSSTLSNKMNYPNFFRTCPNDNNQATVARDIVDLYNWTKIGIIASNDAYGAGLAAGLISKIEDLGGVTPMGPIIFNRSAPENVIVEKVRELRKLNTAVNFISAFTNDSLSVLRAAYNDNMLVSGWTWLGGDGLTALEFSQDEQPNFQSLVGSSLIIGSGTVFDFLSNRYTSQAAKAGVSLRMNVVFLSGRSAGIPRFGSQLFDSITILARTLTKLWQGRDVLNIQGGASPSERQTWLNNTHHALLRGLKTSTVPGAMGLTVQFDANQDGPAAYTVLNYFGTQWQVVGEHITDGERSNMTMTPLNISRPIVWSGSSATHHGSDPPSENDLPDNSSKAIIAYVIIGMVVAIGMGLLLFYAVRKTRSAESTAAFSPVQ